MIFSHVYSVLVIGIERILSIVYNVFLHDILLWCIFRLTPSLMLLMFVYVPLFPYLSDGPFWPQKGLEQGQCNKTWWYNMLYINNFFNEVSINVDILKVGLRLKFSQFFLFIGSYFICLHVHITFLVSGFTYSQVKASYVITLLALYCKFLIKHKDFISA